MTRRAPGGDQRLKVIKKSGTSWILDGPGSQCLVSKGTDTIPGKAAALYDSKKTKTYSHANVVPFIVETGGRINAAGLQFLFRIQPLEAEGTAGLTRRHGRAGISRSYFLLVAYEHPAERSEPQPSEAQWISPSHRLAEGASLCSAGARFARLGLASLGWGSLRSAGARFARLGARVELSAAPRRFTSY